MAYNPDELKEFLRKEGLNQEDVQERVDEVAKYFGIQNNPILWTVLYTRLLPFVKNILNAYDVTELCEDIYSELQLNGMLNNDDFENIWETMKDYMMDQLLGTCEDDLTEDASDDGLSNPNDRFGKQIKARLKLLRTRLSKRCERKGTSGSASISLNDNAFLEEVFTKLRVWIEGYAIYIKDINKHKNYKKNVEFGKLNRDIDHLYYTKYKKPMSIPILISLMETYVFGPVLGPETREYINLWPDKPFPMEIRDFKRDTNPYGRLTDFVNGKLVEVQDYLISHDILKELEDIVKKQDGDAKTFAANVDQHYKDNNWGYYAGTLVERLKDHYESQILPYVRRSDKRELKGFVEGFFTDVLSKLSELQETRFPTPEKSSLPESHLQPLEIEADPPLVEEVKYYFGGEGENNMFWITLYSLIRIQLLDIKYCCNDINITEETICEIIEKQNAQVQSEVNNIMKSMIEYANENILGTRTVSKMVAAIFTKCVSEIGVNVSSSFKIENNQEGSVAIPDKLVIEVCEPLDETLLVVIEHCNQIVNTAKKIHNAIMINNMNHDFENVLLKMKQYVIQQVLGPFADKPAKSNQNSAYAVVINEELKQLNAEIRRLDKSTAPWPLSYKICESYPFLVKVFNKLRASLYEINKNGSKNFESAKTNLIRPIGDLYFQHDEPVPLQLFNSIINTYTFGPLLGMNSGPYMGVQTDVFPGLCWPVRNPHRYLCLFVCCRLANVMLNIEQRRVDHETREGEASFVNPYKRALIKKYGLQKK